ncbi:MAG: hypothetical protein KGL39_05240 [Patescibacteria group bacterium]|nr:hypothetical protein [Patescibacteria group bacterium]
MSLWHKIQWTAILFGLGLASVDQFWPTSWWFEVQKLAVIDTVEGQDPSVVYVRTVGHGFAGRWFAVVHLAKAGETMPSPGEFNPVCEVGGDADAIPTTQGDEMTSTTLGRFMQSDCWQGLKPGHYYLRASWHFRGVVSERTVVAYSNVFSIKAK